MAGRRAVKDPKTGQMKLVPLKGKPYTDKVFRRLEASVPREELERAMDAAPDERAQQLLMRLMDPAFRKHSLPKLAKDVGLTYPQVLHYIQRYRLDEGLLKMSAHVPQVLEDVAIDSKSRIVQCVTCRGTGRVEDVDKKTGEVIEERQCDVCDGEGKLRKIGDADSRKLMFETMKLTGNRGPLVAIQQNMGGAPTMEDSMASVRDVLDVKVEEAK